MYSGLLITKNGSEKDEVLHVHVGERLAANPHVARMQTWLCKICSTQHTEGVAIDLST